MANRYWVGGTGTWNTSSTTNWSATPGGASGASVPTAADSVFFDQASTYTVTMTGALVCLDITVSAGTVTFATGTTPTLAVSGSMSLVAGTVWNSTGTITFNSATTGNTITTNGTTINGPITFNNATGGWLLGSALTLGSTLATTLTAGTLTLNGFNLSTGLFATAGAVARSVAFGTNNITLTAASGTVLSMAVLGGFTYTGTGGFTADASVVRTYSVGSTSGGASTNSPNLTFTGSGTAIPVLTTGSWFNNLNFGTTAFTLAATTLNLDGLTLSSSGTYTNLSATMRDTGTITPNGKTIAAFTVNHVGTTTLAAALSCSTYTQTAGTIDFATFNLTCSSTATYTAGTLSNIGTISCTSWTVNTGSTFTLTQGTITPSTSFIVLSATSTFNYNGGTITTNTFTQTAGTVILGATFTLPATCTYTLTAGTLTLNGFNLSTGFFASTGAGARSVAFGTNNIVLTAASGTVLSMAAIGGFTWSGTGGFTADASVVRTYTVGTNTGNSTPPNLTFTGSGTAIPVLTTGSYFGKLDFGTTAFTLAVTSLNVYTALILSTTGTFTNLSIAWGGTGTITTNGKPIAALDIANTPGTVTLAGALSCTVYTNVSGTIDFANFNLTCSSTAEFRAGTLSNIGTISCTSFTVSTGGTLTLTSGTITPSTSFVVSGNGTFNYNGGTLSPVPTFTHTSGTVSFGKAYALTATGTYSLTAGTLTLNGFDLTTGTFGSSGAGVRAIAFGTNNIIIANTTAATTVLSMASTSNFSWTGTGGFVSDASITRTFVVGTSSGGSATNAPNLTWTGTGSAVQTLTTGSWFNILNFGTTAFALPTTALNLNSLVLSSGGTYTGLTPTMKSTGSITSNGKSIAGLTIENVVGTTTFTDQLTFATATVELTLSNGNLDLSGFNLTVGRFSSNSTATRSIIFGTNNIILAHTTAATTVLSILTATNLSYTGTGGFVSDASITRTFNVGTTAGGSTTSAPNLTFTGSGTAVQTFTTGSWFDILNFGTTAFAVPTTSLYIDTLILSSGGTFTGLQPILTRTQTWTSQFSKQLAGLGFNLAGGTLTLDNTQTYITNSVFELVNGTLDLGGYDLTIGSFTGSNTNTRSILFGSNNIILNWANAGVTNLSMANATNFTYTGTGGFTAAADITRTFVFGTSAGGTSTNSPNLTLTGSGTAVQTFTTGSTFNKLDFGTTSFTVASTSLSVNSLTLSSGGTFTSLTVTTFGTGTLTPNDKTISVLTINCSSGTTTLAGALTTGITSTTTLTSGALDLGGFTLTTGLFSSNNSNPRGIGFGTGNIVLSHTTAATTVLSMATATGFTWTGTGGFTADASITRTYTFGTTGGSATNAPNLSLTGSGTAVQTFTTDSWFDVLNFGTTAFTVPATILNIDTLTLSSGGTFTGLTPQFTRTQTWTAQFSKQLGGIGVNGTGVTLTLDNTQTYTATSVLLLTEGTLDLGGYNLTIGSFIGSNTNTRSILFGSNNIILSTTTAAAVNISMADATNFTCTGTGGFAAAADITRTFTFGTTGGSSTNATNLTLTGSGTAIQTITTGSWFNNLNFGTTAFTIAATTLNLNSLTLSTGGTFTALNIIANGTGTITSNGKTIGAVTINHSGTTTLGGALTTNTTSNTTLTAGTLSLNGYDLTTAAFASTNTNTRAVLFGSNNIILNSSTAGTTVVNMGTATGFTYTGTGGFVTDAAATRTLRFGDVAGGSITNSPKITLTGSGTSVITAQTGSWFSNLNFGTTAFTLPTTSLNLASFTLSSAGTYTGLTATMVDTGTITPNGKTIGPLTINHSGTTTLAGAFGCTTYTQTAGDVNFATFNLTCSSTATYTAGTYTNTGTITCTTWTCAGTFTMTNGTITPSTSFVVTGGFNYNGGTLSPVATFTHTSGNVTLGKAYALTATGLYTLTAGTLDLGGFNLTTGQFSSANTNTRSISFGTGNIVLSHTTAATVNLNMGTATNFTYTGTGGFTAAANITRTFSFGNLAGGTPTNSPNLTLTGSGTAIATLTTGGWFNKLDFGTTAFTLAATTLNLESLTLSVNGTFTNLTANMVGIGTIIPNSKTIAALNINHSGTTQISISYKVYTWTSSGSMTTPASNAPTSIDYLVVAGAGSGVGECTSNAVPGGGGGGGGVVYQTGYAITAGTSTITVGAGATKTVFGAAATAVGGTGSDSSIGSLVVAKGGGGGGSYQAGNSGGSGGGGGYLQLAGGATIQISSGTNPSGAFVYGSAGGTGATIVQGGPGGGGATSAGSSPTTAGGAVGGSGFTTLISGTITAYGGGGGGGGSYNNGGTGGTGGTGGGGNGGNGQVGGSGGTGGTNATSGSANTGGGGGSAANALVAGNGGSGVVIIRYPSSYADLITTGSPTISAGSDTLFVTGTTTLTSGQLDLAYGALSTGIFSSSNTNTRSINFGPNGITLTTSTAASTVLDMATATNFTVTGTPTVTTTTAVTRTFSFGSTAGGSASNAMSLSLTSGAAIPTITSGSWFKTLDFTGTTSTPATTTVYVDTLTLATGGTYTGVTPIFTRTQTWTAQFSKQLNGIGVNGSGVTLTLDNTQTYTATSTCYLTQGTLNLGGSNQTFGAFDSNSTSTRALTFGSNNIVLGHTTAGTTVINAPDITDFSYTGTGGFSTAMSVTRTFTYGSTAGGSASNAINLSLTSGASVTTITSGSWFKTLDFTGTTSTISGIVNVDTLTLATGGTYTGLTPVFTRTQTWTSQFSKPLGGIGVNISSGTLTLDNTQSYHVDPTLYINSGTLNLNSTNQFFSYVNSSTTGSRTITGGGSITYLTSWTVTTGSGFTGSSYTINAYGSLFAGGGGSYGTLVQKTTSTLTITGSNTFADIQVNNNNIISIDYLVVAGGGGAAPNGGGGGAGGYRTATSYLVTSSLPITVTVGGGGAGGAAAGLNNGFQGSDSVFGSITSTGGGYGAPPLGTAGAGGSGGGNGYTTTATLTTGGSGNTPSTSPSQGTNGGGGFNSTYASAGGGGGSSATGGNATNSGLNGGIGGAGTSSSISGTATFYAGGGGGGAYASASGGNGGDGGGGGGSSGTGTSGTGGSNGGASGATNSVGGAGGTNSGGGGGGGAIVSGSQTNAKAGGSGGSGIVIIRYADIYPAAFTTGSPTITVSGGYRVYKWTSSGSIIFP